jgi:hypothetical protein
MDETTVREGLAIIAEEVESAFQEKAWPLQTGQNP